MIRKIKWVILTLIAIATISPAIAEMSPAGETMLAVRAAKAVKNHKEQLAEEEAQKQKTEKLRERYPQEVSEYEKLLTNDHDAAKRKFAAMVTQYKADTGEDLDKTYAVQKREGPLKRLKENISGENEKSSDTGSTSNSSDEKPRRGILNRIFGQ